MSRSAAPLKPPVREPQAREPRCRDCCWHRRTEYSKASRADRIARTEQEELAYDAFVLQSLPIEPTPKRGSAGRLPGPERRYSRSLWRARRATGLQSASARPAKPWCDYGADLP